MQAGSELSGGLGASVVAIRFFSHNGRSCEPFFRLMSFGNPKGPNLAYFIQERSDHSNHPIGQIIRNDDGRWSECTLATKLFQDFHNSPSIFRIEGHGGPG